MKPWEAGPALGLPAWKAAGFAATEDYFGNPVGKLPAKGAPSVVLTVDDVLPHKDQTGYVLVDVRPHNEYVGEDEIWLRKGHIPGAVNFHWVRLMEEDNTHKFKPC